MDITHRSLTQLTARQVLAHGRTPLDAAVSAKVSLCLQDYLSACLDALAQPDAISILTYAMNASGAEEAQLYGLPRRASAEFAALSNGMLGHLLIRDDMHVPSGTHPGVVILPALLAVAQRERLSGTQLARGIAVGYHAMGALGIAARDGLRNRHFRPLGICGAFGATAGIIAALQPSEEIAIQALGLAANVAGGSNQWPWSGGQEIVLHAGIAARNAIVAFDLARAGMTASPLALEGRDGLFAAFGSSTLAPDLFRKVLEEPPHIARVTHKPFAGCNFIQTAMAAAVELHDRLGPDSSKNIKRVVIHTFSAARLYPGCDNAGPFQSVQQTKMSLQFGVAASLAFGKLDEADYRQFEHPEVGRLLQCCEIQLDLAFEGVAPRRQPARVEVLLHDGKTVECELDDVPWLDGPAVQARLHHSAQNHLDSSAIARLTEVLDALWQMPDSAELFELLAW